MKRFPFKVRTARSLRAALDNHSDRTIIHGRHIQSRGFPRQQKLPLASFAARISKSDRLARHGHDARTLFPFPSLPLQGRLHCTQRPRHRIAGSSYPVTPPVRRLPKYVSTEAGSTPACHCGSPFLLNSQHRPQTGRSKPAPETSSICPLTIV